MAEPAKKSAARVNVIAPDGTAGTMSPEEFATRVKSGEKWTTESAQEREQRKYNETAGIGTSARVLAETAVDTATFGGYNVLGGELGGDQFRKRRRMDEEAAPGAKLLGTATGVVLPSLVTGGLGGAGAAARGAAAAGEAVEAGAAARGLLGLGRTASKVAAAPVRGVLNLGRGAETLIGGGEIAGQATRGLLPSLGVTGEGLAARAVTGATKMAASGAVEGAAFGAGQAVSETALAPDGDYSKLAERVIAGGGHGALFGAALGGAVGGVAGLGGKFVSKMADSIGDIGDIGAIAEKNAVKVLAADSRAASEAIEAGYGTRLLKDDVIKGGRSLDEVVARAKTVGREAENIAANTVSVLDDAGRAVETKTLQAELNKTVFKPLMRSNPAAADLLQKELQPLLAGESVGFQELHRLTSNLDSARLWGSAAAPAALKESVQKAQGLLTRHLDDSVTSGLKSLTNEELHTIGIRRGLATEGTAAEAAAHADAFAASMTNGGAARAFSEAQQSAGAAKWAEAQALKKAESVDTVEQAMNLTDNIKGAAGFAMGAMSHGIGMGAVLGTATSAASGYLRKHGRSIIADLAHRAGQADLKIASGVRAFVNGSGRRALVGSAVDVDAVLSRRGKETRADAFERTAQAVRNGVGTEPMVVHTEAPQVGDAMKAVLTRGMQFLQSKLPPGQGHENPFYSPPPPTSESVATFAKYVKAVKDPLSILDSLNNGTVSPHEVEAIQAVYPSLYEQIKSDVSTQLMERKNKKPIPHPQKLNMGILFGIDSDPALELGAYQVIQASYSVTTTGPQGTQTARVSASGGAAAQLSKAMATGADRLEGQEMQI